MKKICHACGQPIMQAHKEVLSKAKLNMLQAAAGHVKSTMVNDFKIVDLDGFTESPTLYNNFSKLRFHGLIAKVKTRQGITIKGRWLITRNGWSFLRGEISLPKYVLIKNNHIQSRADRQVSIRDIFYGDPTMHTTFEYFDEDGKPVGFRPTMAQSQQASLL